MISRLLQTASLFLLLTWLTAPLHAAVVHSAELASGEPQNPAGTAELTLAEQRRHYQRTLQTIHKGLGNRAQQDIAELRSYPLYPYLVKEYLQRELRRLPYPEVDAFLKEFGDTVPGRQLRHRWLTTLYNSRQWDEFLRYYQPDIASRSLQCSYLDALHQTGQTALALSKTTAIWLSPESQPDECDGVFQRWQQAGMQTDDLLWQRLVMALEAGNYRLARYLGSRAEEPLHSTAKRLLWLHRKPELVSQQDNYPADSAYSAELVSYGLRQLAVSAPEKATELWMDYRGKLPFTEQQTHAIRDRIARHVIASGSDEAMDWLLRHDPNADDSYLLEWRIRLAIRQQEWRDVKRWISLLPAELGDHPRWRYWLGRALAEDPASRDDAESLLRALASERHYYGFLAADRLGLEYGLNHSSLQLAELEHSVEQDPAIKRARELFQMNEMTAARREWNQATAGFTRDQLLAATGLAAQWEWHQQAIMTTIKADEWNDLYVRFPLAYQEKMLDSAKLANIEPQWLYAIARQESAFAHDAYSPAGARGLLQLMPATARQVAGSLGIKFSNQDLYSPEKNIALGSHYLQLLMEEFAGNRILATAAYNAGPMRVSRWLEKQRDATEHDVWIETLPYHETRDYVQNVLAFSVIYSYRLGVSGRLISQQEQLIGDPPSLD